METAIITGTIPTLHIRFESRSIDVPLQDIDLGNLSSDQEIKIAAARHLSQPVSKFAAYAVDKNTETGDITLRPQAIFGYSRERIHLMRCIFIKKS